jgi:hypothetical protein
MRVFNLIEDKYDIILSYRLDLKSYNYMNFEINDCINIPTGSDYNGRNDQMAYGNYEVMKKYMNLYLYLPEILNNCILHPEPIMKYYIINYGLKLKRFQLLYYIMNDDNYDKDLMYGVLKKYYIIEDILAAAQKKI